MIPGESLGLYEFTLGSELEYGPSAPAEPNRTELLEAVFLLQGFGEAFDLGETDRL